MKIKMERYYDGWEFSVTTQSMFDDAPITRRYQTDREGYGLWQYVKSTTSWYPDGRPFYEWKQTSGTCQFSLPNDRKRAYDKIRYAFRPETPPA